MMSESSNSSEWKTPRLSDKRLVIHKDQADGPIGAEGKVMLPAAVVQPFSTGDNPVKAGSGNIDTDFLHRPHLRYPNIASPYLLASQTNSPSTPVSGMVSRSSPKIVTPEHFRNYSPCTQERELQNLRCQVQDIQNRLNGDLRTNPEYQQLLSEKLTLEHTLGATELELQELKLAFGNLERCAAISEEKLSRKLMDTMEKQQVIVEKYNTAVEELRRLKDYLHNIPTQEEHQLLQHQVAKKSSQISHMAEQLNLMSNQVKQFKEKEIRQKHEVDVLLQEKEDLSTKLILTENIITDIESQKALAMEQGEDTKEDLLWRLDRFEKEMASAKKLLNYRKQKLESVNTELVEQERKCNEKIQKEIEAGEKLKEKLWSLRRELEEYKTNEQKLKSVIKNSDEKQKKLEERLQLTLVQVKNHQEMNSTIASLFSNLHKAVCTLKDLVKVSQQISQGITPDLSVLLNFTETEEKYESGGMSLEEMKARLTEVRELIQQLESIRSALQDQHAGQVATNTTCAQM